MSSVNSQFYVYVHCYRAKTDFCKACANYKDSLSDLDISVFSDLSFLDDLLSSVDTPFYVGKGQKKRAYDCEYRRNNKWKKFVKNHPFDVAKVHIFNMISERQAFDIEQKLIWIFRDKLGIWLANQTDGGEGPSGFKQSEEMKIKRANSHRGRKNTQETIERMRLAALARKTVYKHTEETKKIIGEASRRQVPYIRTPEIIAKIVAKKKGVPSPKAGKPGIKHSEETKLQMKESQRLRREREQLLKTNGVQDHAPSPKI